MRTAAAVMIYFAVVAGCFLKAVIAPRDVVPGENRYAEKFAAVSYMDGSFQAQSESALSDQVPFSDALKGIYNFISSGIEGNTAEALSRGSGEYILSDSGNAMFKERAVHLPAETEEAEPLLENTAKKISADAENNEDIDIYVYYIELDQDMNFAEKRKIGLADFFFDKLSLPDENLGLFEIDGFEDFCEYFYETDHHWNYKGSYKAYLEVAELLGIDNPLLYTSVIDTGAEFSGSRAAEAGMSDVWSEKMIAYDFDFPDIEVTINREAAADYGDLQGLKDGTLESYSYGDVYGYDYGEMTFDADNDAEGTLLVIGNSYDNAIVKLLAASFDKVYVVDFRFYELYLGEKFDFDEYVKGKNIDKTLFIGDYGWFAKDLAVM